MLTPTSRARMEARSRAAMIDTFRIDTAGDWVSDEGGGGYVTAGSTVDIKCRKGAPSEREQEIAGQVQAAGTAVLIVPLDADVSLSTVGTYINARTGAETRYAVVAIPDQTHEVERRLIVAPAATQGGHS